MARKKGLFLNFSSLWLRHEALYFSIFEQALNELDINEEQRQDEDAISESLCPVLRTVCFQHKNKVKTPEWERPIQPSTGAELMGGKKRKRPDFTCSLINSTAKSPEMYEIAFHVECKRLGKTNGSWKLNKNYVKNGVKRFDSSSHNYGKRAPSGMMIGYMVSMSPDDILVEVNEELKNNYAELMFDFSEKVSSCEQRLNRKYLQPVRFKLAHLWVDLRN